MVLPLRSALSISPDVLEKVTLFHIFGEYVTRFSMFVFSVRTYSHIRKDVNTTVGYKCIPEYRHLLLMKPDLRPSGIFVDEKGTDAQCPMKNVLEHTVKRLCKATDLVENVMAVEAKYRGRKKRYLCYFKYG